MSWSSLGTANRIAVLTLAGSALAEIVGVVLLSELNLIAVIFSSVVTGMAVLAFTGHRAALAVCTAISLLVTVVAVLGSVDQLGETGQSDRLATATIFSVLILTAFISGGIATVRAFRIGPSGPERIVSDPGR